MGTLALSVLATLLSLVSTAVGTGFAWYGVTGDRSPSHGSARTAIAFFGFVLIPLLSMCIVRFRLLRRNRTNHEIIVAMFLTLLVASFIDDALLLLFAAYASLNFL